MRIQGIVSDSITDGPGIRFVVFAQGCPHACPGCHNPQTHDPAGGYEISPEALTAALREHVRENPLCAGVTLSGGEPFEQAGELLSFAREVRAMGLSLWVYTGCTREEIAESGDAARLALLAEADTLVDGRYDETQRTLEIPFVGSRNQRIIENPGR